MPPAAHDGMRGSAFGVASPADWVLGRAPSMAGCALTSNAHKHTATGPPLPEFSLQNTCEFAVQSAVWHRVGSMNHAEKRVAGKLVFMPCSA